MANLPLLVVHEIAKSGRVDDGETQLDTIFFNISSDGLNFDGLGGLTRELDVVVLGRVEGGVEERVNESRLAQAGLANDHRREMEALLDRLAVNLVREVSKAYVALQLLANDAIGLQGM